MRRSDRVKQSTAIVPGSFDPITIGHLDIIKRASKLYDKVYVAVMINPQKNYMLRLDQRTYLAMLATQELENVEVISSAGMLWELARDKNAKAIVKGVRNYLDFEYERKMAEYNHEHWSDAETIFLPSNPKLVEVSSTEVRNLMRANKDISDIIPKEIIKELCTLVYRKGE